MTILYALGICFIMILPTDISAQDYVAPPVSISKEKVRMNGKLYYSHIVLEKQTLYSIAKAYGVGTDEIYSANPTLKETGLKKNAIILIPVIDTGREEKAAGSEEAEQMTQKEEKSAARKAAREEKKKKRAEARQKDYFIHTVKWYENLEVISEKYGIPVDVIMEINGLEGKKLKNRQQLRIPADLDAYMKDTGNAASDHQESAADTVAGRTNLQAGDLFERLTEDRQVNVLLMLPFAAGSETPSTICMDFYSGALLAAKDLGDKGINIDLSVYDTSGDTLPVTGERLEKSDFVIGPPTLTGLSGLLGMCPESTYVISPLDSRTESLAQNHSNFIQVPIPAIAQYEDLLDWIKEEKAANDSIVIIYEKGIRDLRKETEFKKILDDSGLKHSSFSYSILEGRSILESLGRLMTLEGTNRVLVASESEAFVNDVVRNLNLLIHNKYNIVLYGASKIRSYETIDVTNLHNASFHSSMPYHIDYETPEVREFLMKYRALYNTEPSQMAFQGYDIMYYFSDSCAGNGETWAEHLGDRNVHMLMSDFSFEKSGKGLTRNILRRVVYGPDYSVTLVR